MIVSGQTPKVEPCVRFVEGLTLLNYSAGVSHRLGSAPGTFYDFEWATSARSICVQSVFNVLVPDFVILLRASAAGCALLDLARIC